MKRYIEVYDKSGNLEKTIDCDGLSKKLIEQVFNTYVNNGFFCSYSDINTGILPIQYHGEIDINGELIKPVKIYFYNFGFFDEDFNIGDKIICSHNLMEYVKVEIEDLK